jgi:hypothetical protein
MESSNVKRDVTLTMPPLNEAQVDSNHTKHKKYLSLPRRGDLADDSASEDWNQKASLDDEALVQKMLRGE